MYEAGFLALVRARTAICAFGRWIMTLYGTLCSVLRAILQLGADASKAALASNGGSFDALQRPDDR